MSQRKMRPAFYALHAATLDPATTQDQLAAAIRATEAVQERHRLSEGAVYASALRRWLLDTGTDWKAPQQADSSWAGQSDHRLRVRSSTTVGGLLFAACSCGASTWVGTQAGAAQWHRGHVLNLTEANHG